MIRVTTVSHEASQMHPNNTIKKSFRGSQTGRLSNSKVPPGTLAINHNKCSSLFTIKDNHHNKEATTPRRAITISKVMMPQLGDQIYPNRTRDVSTMDSRVLILKTTKVLLHMAGKLYLIRGI